MRILALLALLLGALPAAAQHPIPADAYADARTGELVRLARERRAVVDTRITAYETTARERISIHASVVGLERLLFRRETVSRIDWSRDTVRIEVLGAREAQPITSDRAQLPPADFAALLPALAFDPVGSDMLFRVDSTEILHPLVVGSEADYRFSSGDSTAIRLPDGRTVRLRELRVTARRPEPRLVNGSFWLDSETHALVRAVFRPSRRFSTADEGVSVLTPEFTAEVDHVAIDYGLWDFRWWLPRSVVARGVAEAMGVRIPIAYERSYEGYLVRGDTTSATLPAVDSGRPCRPRVHGSVVISADTGGDPSAPDSAWDARWDRTVARMAAGDTAAAPDTTAATGDGERRPPCQRAFLVTRAEGADLVDGPAFEGSVFEAGEGPVSEEEMRELAALLRTLPENPWGVGRPEVQLLSPDLVRINRVEGLSLGGRAVLPLGPMELRGELRAGTTGEVGARLAALRSGATLRSEAAAYREVQAVDLASQPFGLSSSTSVLLLGRDDNDYFRASGAELRLAPPAARRQGWDLRLFAERQAPLRARSDLSLRRLWDDDFRFRDNVAAERLDQAGATLRLRRAHGDDPARRRTRAELELHGETGGQSFARPLLRLGADVPLAAGVVLGGTLAAGTGFGDLPPQRLWQIGGATSVRGHAAASLRGASVWLARAEIAAGPALGRISLFGDAGWAGERAAWADSRPLLGVGVGVALLGDYLRLDLAQGLDGGGLRLHLRLGGAF